MLSTQDCFSNRKEEKPVLPPRNVRMGKDELPGDVCYLLGHQAGG